jgi:hypothetical protein
MTVTADAAGTDTAGAAGATGPADAQERAREGFEHLQAAARELIQAARAMLDVAEDLVNDPEAVASVAGTVGALGDLVRQRRPAASKPPSDGDNDGDHGDHGDDSPVERITVS